MKRLLVPGIATLSLLLTAAGGRAQDVVFSRDILPILSDNCWQCHGPDPKTRKAKLRLDEEAGAKAERDGTPAILPGHPEKSEALRRILSKDPSEMMPPPRS